MVFLLIYILSDIVQIRSIHKFLYRPGALKTLFFKIPGSKNYTLDQLPVVNNIIDQINCLTDKHNPENFLELIACTLRCILEISMDELISQKKVTPIQKQRDDQPILEQNVYSFLASVLTDSHTPSFLTTVCKTNRISYQHHKNVLTDISADLTQIIKKCNIGAHQSTQGITMNDAEWLAQKISYIVFFANEKLKKDP